MDDFMDIVGPVCSFIVGAFVLIVILAVMMTGCQSLGTFTSPSSKRGFWMLEADEDDTTFMLCVDGTVTKPLNCAPASVIRDAARQHSSRPHQAERAK